MHLNNGNVKELTFSEFLQRIFFCLFLIFTSSCRQSTANKVSAVFFNDGKQVGPTFSLEVSSTPAQRSKGLMYRRELSKNHGMIFIFPDESPRAFWMKNTFISLDIIYLDDSLNVVSIIHSALPRRESLLPSEHPAKYVVELAAGSAKKFGIRTGSTADVKWNFDVHS